MISYYFDRCSALISLWGKTHFWPASITSQKRNKSCALANLVYNVRYVTFSQDHRMSAERLGSFGGKSGHHRAGYFLTGRRSNAQPAPQKQTAGSPWIDSQFSSRCETSISGFFKDSLARVKWWCKRPPAVMVTSLAGKALSGAMPNREAQRGPRHYAFG